MEGKALSTSASHSLRGLSVCACDGGGLVEKKVNKRKIERIMC